MPATDVNARNSKVRTHILDTAQRIVGSKGFSSVGINEILEAAGVPKGSFYYYFSSKELFGTALLEHYFSNYLSEIDEFLTATGRTARDRLAAYWKYFRVNQELHDAEGNGKCLAVKLGAEVSDMSEEMRLALNSGTAAVIGRLARVIKEGKVDGSVSVTGSPSVAAHTLYELWMGASVMWKISHDRACFRNALAATEKILSGKAL
jgi:TetR/AcrR family transcriptional repressor of nem operon